jgi:hypothetical protein
MTDPTVGAVWRTSVWVSADMIAVHCRVKTSTVYKWASQDNWPRRGHYHARLYDLWDAQASYDRRHADDRAHA